jgi:hypothetical protein
VSAVAAEQPDNERRVISMARGYRSMISEGVR